jgi:hypothetical protein
MNDLSSQICPYCNSKLKKVPKRETTCVYCGNRVYVGKSYPNKTLLLLTNSENMKLGNKWREYHERETLLLKLDQFGISEEMYSNYKRKFETNDNNIGSNIDENDLDIYILKSEIDATNEFNKKGNLYFNLATIINENKSETEARIYYRLANVAYLNVQKSLGHKRVTIISSPSCKVCAKFMGILFDIDEEIKNPHIPFDGCPYSTCTAEYFPEI